jgi:hypothetical protein
MKISMNSPEQSFTDCPEPPPEKDGLILHMIAVVPTLVFLSFLIQAIQARLILGRSLRTCVDEIPGRLFEAHRFGGDFLFLFTVLLVIPLFSAFILLRKIRRGFVGKLGRIFMAGLAMCLGFIVVDPWNYVSWWLD